MNFSELPISEAITAIIAAVIGWFTSGKMNAKTGEIDNAKKLIEEWMKLHSGCEQRVKDLEAKFEASELRAEKEREELKDTILRQDQKIKMLENHIKKVEKG